MRPFTLLPSFEFCISKNNSFYLYIFYAVVAMSTTIISLAISLSLFSSSKEKTVPYFQLLENWNQPFLSDIKATTQDECPNGYSRLFSYHWSGTNNGCYCRDAYWLPENRHGRKIILDSGLCTTNQTIAGCVDVRSIPGRDFSRWRDFKILCGKRMEGTSFVKNFPKYPGDCPEDSLKCGGEDSDSSFCIPNSFSACPITSIIVSKAKPGNEYKESVTFDEGDNLKLYWTREALKTPISEFRINEETVCLNDNHAINIAFDRSEYRLAINSRARCTDPDPRFKSFDQISEYNFFKYNQMSFLEDVLPEYRLSNNVNWKIFTRSYIAFKLECRYMINKLVDYREDVQKMQTANEKWINYICIFEILSILLNIVYAIVCFKNSPNTFVLQIIAGFLNYLGRYCCLTYAGEALKTSGVFKDLINNLRIFDCSDNLTNSYFKMIRDDDPGFYIQFLNNINFFIILVDVAILIGAFFLANISKVGTKNQ